MEGDGSVVAGPRRRRRGGGGDPGNVGREEVAMGPGSGRAYPGAAAVVKVTHSVLALVMMAAGVYVLWCGLTGQRGAWLGAAIALLAVEAVAYTASGLRCPLTRLARALGDPTGHDWLLERLLPPSWLRWVAPFYGLVGFLGLLAIGIASLAAGLRGAS